MIELFQRIPDAETVLALEPEELAGIVLFILRQRYPADTQFHLGNIAIEFDNQSQSTPHYPRTFSVRLKVAFIEAVTWLVSQGLIIQSPQDPNWKILSRKAQNLKHLMPMRHLGPANFSRGKFYTRISAIRFGCSLLEVNTGIQCSRSATLMQKQPTAIGNLTRFFLGFEVFDLKV